ncbi:MAG: response regulator [Anaerolineae bacterium]|nr:response regulator [Anaerolineae bacterium]
MNTLPMDLLHGWKVVVVDDEEDSLEVAQIILEEYGADVSTAANGQEGLELIRKVHPKLVISDISMPVMDGWGLIFELKNDRTTCDIPAIALTAHAMIGDRERAISAGFHNYLTKPLTASTFIQDLVGLLVEIPQLAFELPM